MEEINNKKTRQIQILEAEISRKRDSIKNIIENIGRLDDRHSDSNSEGEKIDLESKIEDLKNKKIKLEGDVAELERQKEALVAQLTEDKSSFKDVTENTEALGEATLSPLEEESGAKKEFGSRSTATAPLDDEKKLSELKRLFQEGGDIENTLIYVATFFEGLSTNEFNEVVSSFLQEKIVEVTVEKELITPKGKKKFFEEKEKRNALEVWRESLSKPDKYLKKCRLKSIENNQSRVIDFEPSALRTELRSYLKEEQPLYIDELLEKAKLFMFHRRTQIAKGGLTILTDAMLTYPAVYNDDWLIKIVNVLVPAERSTDVYELTLLQILQQLITQLEPGKIEVSQFENITDEKWVFSRFAGLIYFMLNNESLQPTVKKFLNRLMDETRYYAVSEIVDNLDHVEEFDSFYWIKRLLDNAKGEARTKAYNILYRKLKISGFLIYDLLNELFEWLPEPGGGYSPSAKAALSIVVDYCSNTVLAYPDEKYGLYKSDYMLFQPFCAGEVDKKFSTLFSWLFFTDQNGELGIDLILKDDIDSIEFLGELIAEWFMILSGFSGDIPPENLTAIDIMVDQMIESLRRTPKIQTELAQFWKELADFYLYRINRLPKTKDRSPYRRLVKRRNLLRNLSKRFKAARKTQNKLSSASVY